MQRYKGINESIRLKFRKYSLNKGIRLDVDFIKTFRHTFKFIILQGLSDYLC